MWTVLQFAVTVVALGFVGVVCYKVGQASVWRQIEQQKRHLREVTRTDDRVEAPRNSDAEPSRISDTHWVEGYWGPENQ